MMRGVNRLSCQATPTSLLSDVLLDVPKLRKPVSSVIGPGHRFGPRLGRPNTSSDVD